jgi:hypothetical protein
MMKASRQFPQFYDEGRHHLWQDFSAVNKEAGPMLLNGLCKFAQQLVVNPGEVDHYVVSIPTIKFYADHLSTFLDQDGGGPFRRWLSTWLAETGAVALQFQP